jgi:hypothetical protein
MENLLRRRDRGAAAALVLVLLATGLVSAAVDHRRGGGRVLPAAQTASRVLGQQQTAGGSGAGLTTEAITELVTGGSSLLAASGPLIAPAAPAPGGDEAPFVPDEPPEIPEPPVPLVPGGQLPPAVKPLTQLSAPLGAEACQYLGLIPLAVALGGALGGAPVSLEDLLPYMGPLFDACLVVGVPDTETDCAVDQQIDDGADLPPVPAALGLTVGETIEAIPVPTPMGVFIDEMKAVELLALGPPKDGEAPRFSDRLEAALACSTR